MASFFILSSSTFPLSLINLRRYLAPFSITWAQVILFDARLIHFVKGMLNVSRSLSKHVRQVFLAPLLPFLQYHTKFAASRIVTSLPYHFNSAIFHHTLLFLSRSNLTLSLALLIALSLALTFIPIFSNLLQFWGFGN